MSGSEDIEVMNQRDFDAVWTLAMEPSYVSEIARKMRLLYDDWAELNENTAVRIAANIVHAMENNFDVEISHMGPDAGGQLKSSPKYSIGPNGMMETEEWRDYKIIYNRNAKMEDTDEKALELVDMNTTLQEKRERIKNLSEKGNIASRKAEEVLQDILRKQFRHYDVIETPDYNDPGVDFYVEDEGNREWGLAVEISTRYVNPIGEPYVDSKKESSTSRDADLLILAPRFTGNMFSKYEDDEDPIWHVDPEGEMVHLHRLPPKELEPYKPFIPVEEESNLESDDRGNPIVTPDSGRVREMATGNRLVGDEYPVVDSNYTGFIDDLGEVERDWVVIPEMRYRYYIRESIEPMLWEFLRPYKIQQFILDTYWDKELTQGDIGRLVDRAGSTIGTWMQRHGVMRRGTGAPELSDEVVEIWKRMYEGQDPFPEQFSGYRIQAEYNRHPLWDLDDWSEWYKSTTPDERQEYMSERGSYRDNVDYTVMLGAEDRLLPSYSFILRTLREEDVDVRPPDEAPRVPYSAYPSKDALEYMLNRDQDTIVDVSENG